MPDLSAPDDKRRHLRLPIQSTVFIELVSPGVGNASAGRVVTCKTLDVSRGGLRVSLAQELIVGAILQIGGDLPDNRETLYLAGEVRWCEQAEGSEALWFAGFQLLNADTSDIDSWIALLAGMDS